MANATRNKWLKYKFMKTRQLLPYLPETQIMTRDSLWNLVKKYRRVIVKPVKGSRGSGVIQISSIGNNKYVLHYENRRITIQGKEKTYQYLKRKMGSSKYIVQRRISRPTVNGRPFDMRVIVQRRRNSNVWAVTGEVAKIAGKGYIVSNISRSKGTVMPVKIALKKSSIQNLSTKTLQSKIKRVAILTARRLESFFKGHRIYGLDIALDKNGHVWIIEANLFPILSHFRKLKNKTMYRRIMEYKEGWTPNDSYEEEAPAIYPDEEEAPIYPEFPFLD
ncbi:YheC/YheD family protein [Thermoflavimicrobium dichotomicum]|uniref:YheC/D like ATP-grasp n=1 Tax=Thermoflavimicrobium dichotomicum TaxID=46223 RepID=A0A1I3UWK9_9BACL|nr:YheC/YheD family protein [Thermoflavimicrobium dichotomicum]SFJ87455.1 YheC/D like ATP-grasp [Thermoflavimicrobium dichotomicum]